MSTKEHLESYIYGTKIKLKEFKNIGWPENQSELNRRVASLEHLLKTTISELNHLNRY